MTKHFARLALAGAAVAALALPAAPASACGTFINQCVQDVLDSVAVAPICYEVSATLAPICVG